MKILIGTPVYDRQLLTSYHVSVVEMLQHFAKTRPQVDFRSSLPSLSVISMARNALASTVLEEDYTHLLFIDADMGFRPSLIEKMIDFDKPVVGSVAPHRVYDYERLRTTKVEIEDERDWRYVVQNYVGGERNLVIENGRVAIVDGFARAHRAGTGIMLIKREALERLREAYPELWTENLHGAYQALGLKSVFQVFESLQVNGLYWSEDHSFCRRWTDIGGEIWSCINETIEHVGRESYVGNYARRLILEGRGKQRKEEA